MNNNSEKLSSSPSSFDAVNTGGISGSVPHVTQSPAAFKKQTRFRQTEYKDIWALVVFCINMVIYYGLVGYSIYLETSKSNGSGPIILRAFSEIPKIRNMPLYLTTFGFSLLASFILTALAAICIFFNPVAAIQGSIFGMILWNAVSSVILFNYAGPASSISGIVGCIALIFFYFYVRKRIPFSAAILKAVVSIFHTYPASIWISALGILIQGLNLLIFVASVPGMLMLMQSAEMKHARDFPYPFIFLLFSFSWQTEVLVNIVQTTVAGLVATVFLASGHIVNPTLKSLKRASTISLGSIILGSLLVALVELIKNVVKSIAGERGNIFAAIADCFLSLLERLVQYFNFYAYTYIAIYGNSYITSAKQVYGLIKARGVDAMVNDNLVGTVFGLLTVVIGLTCGLVAYLVALMWLMSGTTIFHWELALVCVLCGLAGTVIPLLLFEVFKAAVTAVFVCYAEEPQAVQINRPELFEELKARDTTYV